MISVGNVGVAGGSRSSPESSRTARSREDAITRSFHGQIITMGALMIRILKILSFSFTGLLCICGFVLIVVGCLALSNFSGSDWINSFQHMTGIFSIILGLITISISLFGIFAIIKENPHIVMAFIAFLIVAAIASTGLGFMSGKALKNYPEDSLGQLRSAAKVYNVNPAQKKKIDNLQKTYKCCGIDDPSSWSSVFVPPSLPISCCTSQNKTTKNTTTCKALKDGSNFYKKSCWNMLNDIVDSNQRCIMAVAIMTAIDEVILLILSVCLTFGLLRQHQWKSVIVSAFKEASAEGPHEREKVENEPRKSIAPSTTSEISAQKIEPEVTKDEKMAEKRRKFSQEKKIQGKKISYVPSILETPYENPEGLSLSEKIEIDSDNEKPSTSKKL